MRATDDASYVLIYVTYSFYSTVFTQRSAETGATTYTQIH